MFSYERGTPVLRGRQKVQEDIVPMRLGLLQFYLLFLQKQLAPLAERGIDVPPRPRAHPLARPREVRRACERLPGAV